MYYCIIYTKNLHKKCAVEKLFSTAHFYCVYSLVYIARDGFAIRITHYVAQPDFAAFIGF
jgi:ribosomal protein S3